MNERKRKLFVGIELDAESRLACSAASERLRTTGFAAKYEAPEKLHVTVAFLGYVEPSRVASVVEALAAAAEAGAFAVSLDKLGAFPHERKPRVVFVGAREQGAQFRALAKRVRDAYAALGFEFKDDAVAHVTIARVKPPQRPLPLIEVSPIPLWIERLTLFESLPDRANNTTRYEAVERAVLPLSS
jgi:RNA 2',3'-cyclic 3'-phosphodiesterase